MVNWDHCYCHQIELLGDSGSAGRYDYWPLWHTRAAAELSSDQPEFLPLVFNQLGGFSRYVAGPDARFHIHHRHSDND